MIGTPVAPAQLPVRWRWLGWAATVVAVPVSAAGLAVPGAYRDSDALVELTRADDVFRLVVVAPILAIGLLAGRRGAILGDLAALGALLVLAYLYGFLAFGAAIGPLTLAHIALLGLAFWALLLGFLGLDSLKVAAAVEAAIPRTATSAFLVAMAILSTVQWGAAIVGAASSGAPPADLVASGRVTNPLYAIELALAVPLMATAGVGLALRRPIGSLLAVPLLVFLALLGLGLAWEPVFAVLEGAPFDGTMAAAGLVFLLIPAGLLAVIFTATASVDS